MMKSVPYIPTGLIVYLVVTGLLQATARTQAAKAGDALVFGPTTAMRWILITLIVGFAGAALYSSFSPPPSAVAAAIFGFISIVGTIAFPPEIYVTSSGITAVKWWGTKTTILWKEVSRIEFHRGPSTTMIQSKVGAKIVHSGWNRDGENFRRLCKSYSNLPIASKEL